MLVWLTDWQLSEDHVLIRVGDVVDWTIYASDRRWLARLFADRLSIEWQFDTYGDAVDQPALHVRGEVTSLLSARCRQVVTAEGRVPVSGAAQLLPVEDTSGSWTGGAALTESEPTRRPGRYSYSFSYTSLISDSTADPLYGYVAMLDVSGRPGGR
jgi:hypothetical protein